MTIRLLDPNRGVNGFGKETTTATIVAAKGTLENGSMTMTMKLLGLLMRRREGAGKGQAKGKRRGGSESVRDGINRP